ncbi:MAG: hypothetical protein K8E24_013375 [Methanobacterium paludis]|nr:hypothetical protein [Methanobacterium paludis]
MKSKYLKGDIKRVDKKLEELNLKYENIMFEKAMKKLEDRKEELKEKETTESLDFKGKVLKNAYEDVIQLERKNKKKSK